MDFFFVILGLVILVLAGDVLVRGSVNLSLRLGVPALIVSMTIVAIGTSAPELLIAINAVIENAPGIAVGNVVGSNTANVLLVLGLPALITGLNSADCEIRSSYMQMLFGTALFVPILFLGPITWVHGIILLAMYATIIAHAIRVARQHRRAEAAARAGLQEVEGADPGMRWWKICAYLGIGLIGLPIGADILVESASSIARAYNISDAAIGLTLVAVGTSLPELATTVSAALRRQADVALGNVIGSNMANLLGIVGVASFFGDIPVAPQILQFDIWVMVGASLLLGLFVFRRFQLNRMWGGILLALYISYIIRVLI